MEKQHAGASDQVVQLILDALSKDGVIEDSFEFARSHNKHHVNEVIPSIKKLEANEKVTTSQLTCNTVELTEEGERYAESGSPEAQIFALVPKEGIDQKQLQERNPIGFAQAMKNKVRPPPDGAAVCHRAG